MCLHLKWQRKMPRTKKRNANVYMCLCFLLGNCKIKFWCSHNGLFALHLKLLKVRLASSVTNKLQCVLRPCNYFPMYVIDDVMTIIISNFQVNNIHSNVSLSIVCLYLRKIHWWNTDDFTDGLLIFTLTMAQIYLHG